MMTEGRMYTTKEVAKIMSIDYKRIHKDMKKLIVKPTDIVKGKGRGGITYVFDVDTVRKYAASKGIYDPDFSIVGGNEDRMTEDGGIVLTPENFNRVVHGCDDPVGTEVSGDTKFLRRFMAANDITIKDLAYIIGKSENTAKRLESGLGHLQFEDVMALCAAAKVSSIDFDIDDYFANDPNRLKALKSWVPYEKAKLMQEYADLQARMKQIEKELGGK